MSDTPNTYSVAMLRFLAMTDEERIQFVEAMADLMRNLNWMLDDQDEHQTTENMDRDGS